jgi:hypothetical protein
VTGTPNNFRLNTAQVDSILAALGVNEEKDIDKIFHNLALRGSISSSSFFAEKATQRSRNGDSTDFNSRDSVDLTRTIEYTYYYSVSTASVLGPPFNVCEFGRWMIVALNMDLSVIFVFHLACYFWEFSSILKSVC